MAAKANIVIDQGSDYSTIITVTDDDGDAVDLTGYTGSGQMRKHYTSETKTDFNISFASPRFSGKVEISMARDVTETLEPGRYVYDVEITSASNIRSRLVEGIVTVTPEVTR